MGRDFEQLDRHRTDSGLRNRNLRRYENILLRFSLCDTPCHGTNLLCLFHRWTKIMSQEKIVKIEAIIRMCKDENKTRLFQK